MSNIIKTFAGKHIDLSKVVAISDAYENGNLSVGFEIDIQLLDKPLKFSRYVEDGEYDRKTLKHIYGEDGIPLAIKNMQKQIDDLIEQWKSINRP